MNLEIQAHGIPQHEDVARFAKCRAELALGPLRDRIDAVNVFVRRRDDVEADAAIRCLVMVKSATRPDVVVERTHGNLYVAIHLAVDEAGWALADSCAREQDAFLERQLEALAGTGRGAADDCSLAAGKAA